MSTWIFGYGSLVWKPAIAFRERVPAVLDGFERRFWQGSPDHRGTPERPGRVVTVLPAPGSRIGGMAYRIDDRDIEEVRRTLGIREQAGYAMLRAPARLEDGRVVEVDFYTAGPGNPSWLGPAPIPEVARHIASAQGPSGTNLTYLLQLERALAALGQADPHVSAITHALAHPWRVDVVQVPRITGAQLAALDRALHDGGIHLVQRMENAGSALARVARNRFLVQPQGSRVVVLAGPGGNGGGALVAARRLAGWGASVQVVLARELKGEPARQLRALELAQVPVQLGAPTTTGPIDLVIDGLLGASPRGEPAGTVAELIDWANEQEAPVLALDVPSGVHGERGPASRSVQAVATVALGLPSPASTGEIWLADVGIPPVLYERVGLEAPCLRGDLVQLAFS